MSMLNKTRLEYSKVFSSVKENLVSRDGKYNFSNNFIAQAVSNRYYNKTDIRKKMISYFQNCTDVQRIADELPSLLFQIGSYRSSAINSENCTSV